MGHMTSVHQGLSSLRGKSLGTRLVEEATVYTPCVNFKVDSLFIAVDADWFVLSRCEKRMIE
jgi:hypothetical protein